MERESVETEVKRAAGIGEIKRIILRWLPAIAWMILIFWFSSQPQLPRPASDLLNLVMRKSAHFAVFGVLALCYVYGLGGWHRRPAAFILTVLYAISDEYHQSFTPLRQPAWTDVLIDTAGALTALWLLGPWLQRWFIAGTTRSWAADHDQASGEKHV